MEAKLVEKGTKLQLRPNTGMDLWRLGRISVTTSCVVKRENSSFDCVEIKLDDILSALSNEN